MSIELMLNAVNLSIVAFGAFDRRRSARTASVIALHGHGGRGGRGDGRAGDRHRDLPQQEDAARRRVRRDAPVTPRAADGRPALIPLDHRRCRWRLPRSRALRRAAASGKRAAPGSSRSARSSLVWVDRRCVVVVQRCRRRAPSRSASTATASRSTTWIPARRLPGRRRLLRRQPDRVPADRRHDDRHARPRLLDRLHEPRPGLLAVLRLPEPVHVLDAAARPRRQLPRRVRGLGAGRPVELPADRLLVPQARRPRSPRRRRSSSTASATSGSRSGSWPSSSTPGTLNIRRVDRRPARRDADGLPDPDLGHRAARLRRAPSARAPSSRSTSGCPTRWRARRRSRP